MYRVTKIVSIDTPKILVVVRHKFSDQILGFFPQYSDAKDYITMRATSMSCGNTDQYSIETWERV